MISIVIPTYNRLETLKRCIESILTQKSDDLEVIVIDDCSKDSTRDYLIQVNRIHPFIKVIINEKNYGVNYSRNRGIELASKKYIFFLDSDDALAKDALVKVQDTLVSHPGTSHFLFVVSDRAEFFKSLVKPEEVKYEDWVSGRVGLDYTHVVLAEILKKFLFFEQFRMFEHLNWLRVKKETSPQLLVPLVAVERERDRSDSLLTLSRLKDVSSVKTKFEAQKLYYNLYHQDLKRYNPRALSFSLIEAVLLGVASKSKVDSHSLIKYADKLYVRCIGFAILLMPSFLARYIVINYSGIKNRFTVIDTNRKHRLNLKAFYRSFKTA